jgi:hypothetical protein
VLWTVQPFNYAIKKRFVFGHHCTRAFASGPRAAPRAAVVTGATYRKAGAVAYGAALSERARARAVPEGTSVVGANRSILENIPCSKTVSPRQPVSPRRDVRALERSVAVQRARTEK